MKLFFLACLLGAAFATGCYTDYQQNVGMFPESQKLDQRQFRSLGSCQEWCDANPCCKGVAVSPAYWAYRECFLVGISHITTRRGWSASFQTECDRQVFKLVDSGGYTITQGVQIGLLLVDGNTVCDDSFSDNTAAAICREMGFLHEEVSWNSGSKWDIQNNYNIGLDDVRCSSTYWSSCTYITSHNCRHHEDIFLTCGQVPVDGEWSSFSDWSKCSVVCGGGSQSRIRSCSNPAPANGGVDCNGDDSESQNCNADPCPVDGGWSEFSDWSECSVACGGGSQHRTRSCSNPAPANEGVDCNGDDSESQVCNADPCPAITWRDDRRCGPTFPLADGSPSQCNPDHPLGAVCCSKWGWCSLETKWCVDYGVKIAPPKLWRDDGRCGAEYPLPNGLPAQCDPDTVYSCCSPWGYCGQEAGHCDCETCVDYAK